MASQTRRNNDLIELLSQMHSFDMSISTREVYLHSHYGTGYDDEGGIEYRMATQFIKNLHFLDQLGRANVLVHMQSPGGHWSHGMAVYDAMSAAKFPVTVLVYGEASSMSGIVLQAATKRILMPNCEFMVHRVQLSLDDNLITVKSTADWSAKTDQKMLQIFANRAVEGPFFKRNKMSKNKIISFIDSKIRQLGDWYMDAEEAVDYGLADGIFGTKGFETFEKIRK